MDETLFIALLIVFFNGAFDALVVAWIAAKRSPGAFDKWIRSDKAKPALSVIAENVRMRVLPDLPTSKALQEELDKVRTDLGHMHAELSAEMPPNIDGRVAAMEKVLADAITRFDTATETIASMDHSIGVAFTALDSKLGALFGEQGANEAAMRKMAEQVEGEIEGAMQGAVSQLDTRNPMVRQFYALATKPIDEKWAAKHPFAAMFTQGGKMWFAENILPMFAEGETGSDLVRLKSTTKGERIL